MNSKIIYGGPLSEFTKAIVDKKPKMAIIFIIDGCRADTLYNALENGNMPKLKRFMEEVGYQKYENCFTIFPSVTGTFRHQDDAEICKVIYKKFRECG